jgi:hypothetical protein
VDPLAALRPLDPGGPRPGRRLAVISRAFLTGAQSELGIESPPEMAQLASAFEGERWKAS